MIKRKKRSSHSLPKYEDWLIESLKKKKKATIYLQTAIEAYQNDNDPAPLLLAFRHVALAQGGMARLAKKTRLSRETLYRILSKDGNPRLETIGRLLQGLGFRLAIEAA